MLILPYSTALSLNRISYVTFSIILICVVIFYFQLTNRADIVQVVNDYCYSINDTDGFVSKHDQMALDGRYCNRTLQIMHNQYDIANWQVFYLENYRSEEANQNLRSTSNLI